MTQESRILILGGGITGLALAYYLEQQAGKRAILLERSERVGGLVCTEQLGGSAIERGPHSLRPKGGEAIQLIKELGLESDLLVAAPSARRKYLLLQGHLVAMPRSPFGVVANRWTRCLALAAWRERNKPPATVDDESVYSFAARRFSKEVAERFADPIVTGIFAGDAKELSVRSCFPHLFQWERSFGSVMRGRFQERKKRVEGGLVTLRGGVEQLPQALGKLCEVRLRCSVTALRPQPFGVEVETTEGILTADRVVSTLPSYELALLTKTVCPEAASLLATIPYASVILASAMYRRPVLRQEGFGYLVPSSEGGVVMGCIFDSMVFPEQNRVEGETRLTLMLGGTRAPDLETLSDERLERLALNALYRHLKVSDRPNHLSIYRAPRAIPQYLVGHENRMQTALELLSRVLPSLRVAGSFLDGPGIEDRLRQANRCATAIAQEGGSC